MIHPQDPSEWLAQIQATPESAPDIVRSLVAHLVHLEEANEELRNINIELRNKSNPQAHQREVDELGRQIEALADLVRARARHATSQALLVWSDNGHALGLDLARGDVDEAALLTHVVRFPAQVQLDLRAVALAQQVLALTNLGQGVVFKVHDLIQVTREATQWHKIPDLNLGGGEFLAAVTPIGDLPLSHSLVTVSQAGYARSISRWSLDRFLFEAQFGRGSQDDRDILIDAQLCPEPDRDVILFTRRGRYLRFPVASLSPGATLALKLDRADRLVSMLLDDPARPNALIVDTDGHAIRRPLESFRSGSPGRKPLPACASQAIVGVRPLGDFDRVVVLMQNGRLALVDAEQIPLSHRSRPLAALPEVTFAVRAFTTTASF
jgi:DNA gyrase/topoisomerase IV subunit A